MNSKKSAVDIQAFIMALSVFLSMQPYFLWHKEGVFLLGHLTLWYVPMTVAVIGCLNRNKNSRSSFYIIPFVLLLLLYSVFQSAGFQSIFLLCLAFVPFLKREFALSSLNY